METNKTPIIIEKNIPMKLLSITELFQLMQSEEKLVLLDCRFDLMNKNYGRDGYAAGHIKGAYYVDIEKECTDPVSEHGGRHPFRDVQALASTLASFGVTKDSTVVTYDDGDMQGAGRLLLQLKQLGLSKVYALDGGLRVYKQQGGELETTPQQPLENPKALNIDFKEDFLVSMDYVKSKLYNPETILIDSRSKARYLGREEFVDKKAGHIPSAKSYFFMDTLSQDEASTSSFRSEEELREHFKDLDPSKEIIVYCGSGISLTVNALALDKIGIPYKVYPGSFSDWISYDDNEIETKEE